MIKTLIATVRRKLDDRERYNRALAEIEAISPRELSAWHADPAEMAREVHAEIYGRKA